MKLQELLSESILSLVCAKNIKEDKTSIKFRTDESKKYNIINISLNRNKNYDITFGKINGIKINNIKIIDNVIFDNLEYTIESNV